MLLIFMISIFTQVLDRSVTDNHIDISKEEYKQRRQALMDKIA